MLALRVFALVSMLAVAAGDTSARDSAPMPGGSGAALGMTLIAGRLVTCHDIRGVAVHTMQVTGLGDVGRAGVVNRVPIIAIDPDIIGKLPDKLALFFFQHECAHHVLGHWFQPSTTMEVEADCWAIKHDRDRGNLSRDEVRSFAPFLARSGGSPFGHLPGPERAKQLVKCFDAP
ncbi:MAG: hypothetical protein KDJ47_12370 [Hyphomicrobiaceae bacterium]|nr:hypothetical protein [Hyphomicrobiaceae bacterium]